ncbi:GNAT family N-acetyltransferase [Mangrovimicrobium sediminis]|uniref:GNAT family N-acetyltransferase n=1 Tax=Mangrovimicrobium sediminis TaxID=2562682 RepID=A0A4Z0M520_9GAMM|nr:GNAT family N-acetyltransferase [Haliea sp. SAOS-164]TGD74793.1 GNAT family N-acetyltransferase [Haliea sp. SAOS-164]
MAGVTVYYLEMTSPGQLRGKPLPAGLSLAEARVPQFAFNRFLYEHIGGPWAWRDKLSWSDAQWRAYVEAENLRTWVAWVDGSPAGYFDLEREGDEVEIKYFGLAPAFIGQGYGGALLTSAIEAAWGWDAPQRVWVHTCTLDHPNALANYQARGMQLYRSGEAAASGD